MSEWGGFAVRTVVHLLRHGEVYNPEKVLYGRLPGYGLSELGQAQAKLAAEYLAGRPVGHIRSSPLERAQQTAAPLASALGLAVRLDHRLIEAENFLQGRPLAGGQNLRSLVASPADVKYFRNPLRPSWGEPYTMIASRVLSALRATRDEARTLGATEAVCVSHQLPIVMARRAAEGERLPHDPRSRQCGLASVTSFTYIDDLLTRVDYCEPAATLPTGVGLGA